MGILGIAFLFKKIAEYSVNPAGKVPKRYQYRCPECGYKMSY